MTMRKPPGIHENPLLCYSSRLELQKRSTFLTFILLKRKDPIQTFAHFADNGLITRSLSTVADRGKEGCCIVVESARLKFSYLKDN